MKAKNNIKVARIISALWPGGVEKKLTILLPRLKREGLDVTVICLKTDGELAQSLRDQGIDVVTSKMPSRWSPSGLWKLKRFIKSHNFDVVHTHMYRSNTSGTAGAWLAGTPVIVNNIHNVDSWDDQRQIMTDKLLSKFRDCTVFVSRGVAENYLKSVSLPSSRYRVIYNGVDTEFFKPSESEHESDDDTIIIGAAARLMPQKGLDVLVRAASSPVFKDKNVKFLIAGDGPLREELEQTARSNGAGDRFEILGFIDDIRDFYRGIDILAMPSHKEGFSNALVEAMACGLASVVTNVGGNAEAVVDGDCGYVVAPGQEEAFIEALEKLVIDKETRRSFSVRARERSLRFSLDGMVHDTIEMYLTLLEENRK